MGKMIISGGGGINLDEVTGTPNDLIKGKSAYLQGSDDPQTGTLELTGNATDGYVYSGKTYYNTDAKMKRTGTMTVGSILAFSAQAYSGRQILLKWQNPYAATGRPFSGIHVWYSTGRYPGVGGGTWIYSGYGGNTASGGWCQALVTLPNLNTTYYFTACSYVTCSAGDIWGTAFNAAAATGTDLWLTFTASQNYTVPEGYSKAVGFAVGGGGGGCASYYQSSGGGGGYTSTSAECSVRGGQVLTITVGFGGAGAVYSHDSSYGTDGGLSSISGIVSASGGRGGGSGTGGANDMRRGAYCNGGSGGGETSQGSMFGAQMPSYKGGNGGSDGGNGQVYYADQSYQGCRGQGRTTRAWGDPTGTLFSGGGGAGDSSGGGYGNNSRGMGGAGGGGNGGLINTYQDQVKQATSGGTNTGGGGGGSMNGGQPGGTGIILLHLY